MFGSVTAQTDNGLEQQFELVVIQRLFQNCQHILIRGHAEIEVAGVVQVNPVALLMAFQLMHMGRGFVGAPQQLAGFWGAVVDQGDPDTAGGLHGPVGDFKQLVFHRGPQAFRLFQGLAIILAHQQNGKGVITQARQYIAFVKLFAQQVGNVAQHQVGAGDTGIRLDPGEVVDGDIEQGALQLVGQGLFHTSVQAFAEVLPIVQASEQILTADFLELFFQLDVVLYEALNHLGAALAVIGGRQNGIYQVDGAAVTAQGGTTHFIVFGGTVMEILEKGLEVILVFIYHRIHGGDTHQVIDVFIAEHVQVGLVGIDMHAVADIGDGIHGAVEQQLAAFFRFLQVQIQGAAAPSLLKVAQLPVNGQQDMILLGMGNDVTGAEFQGFHDQLGLVAFG